MMRLVGGESGKDKDGPFILDHWLDIWFASEFCLVILAEFFVVVVAIVELDVGESLGI